MSGCSHFTAGLEETLAEVARVGAPLQDPWWVVGSAAIALVGVNIEVPHVELLVSERDAHTLLIDWAAPQPADAWQDRLRAIRGLHASTPIPIAVIGQPEVMTETGWRPVVPSTRVEVTIAGGHDTSTPQARALYIPDPDDQLALLLLFRRPQDLVRAELLLLRP